MQPQADPNLTAAGLPRKSSPNHGGPRPGAGRKPDAALNDSYQLLAKAKAKRETYRAHIAELEFKQKAGELVAVSDVIAEWGNQIQIAKGRLLALPARLAPDMVRSTDIRTAERAIRSALISILEELSGGQSAD